MDGRSLFVPAGTGNWFHMFCLQYNLTVFDLPTRTFCADARGARLPVACTISSGCSVTCPSLQSFLSLSLAFTGKAESSGRMHVTLCDYIMPWDSLSTTQKKSLSQRYQMGCECKVRHRMFDFTVQVQQLKSEQETKQSLETWFCRFGKSRCET